MDLAEDSDPYEVFSAAIGAPVAQNNLDGAKARKIAENSKGKIKQRGFEASFEIDRLIDLIDSINRFHFDFDRSIQPVRRSISIN